MDETIFYGESVEERIKRRFSESSTNRNMDSENPFYVGDLGEIHRQHMKWKSLLPRIEPFYAVKCNPDPLAVKYLASLGVGFDCASKTEMEQALYSGADASRIIYAQPTKQLSFLKYAHQNNISLMTFDSQEELLKIKNSYPEAKLVLRILVDDTHSAIPLGRKYGAPIQTVESLLHIAKNLKLNVVGVSFHVGSGCTHANAFYHAIARARDVFDQAKSIGFSFDLLDVGGGFNESTITSDKGATFEDVAKVLGPTVDEMFPSNNVRVIAEPGRYYVGGPAYTLCVGIVGRRTIEEGQTRKYMYYLNDGFYGSFLMPTLDKIKLNPKVLRKDGKYYYDHVLKDEKTYPCTIWGPTGCSLDCVIKDGKLPELNAGDWLYFEKFGAYSVTAATTFNGFEKPDMIHVNSFKE
ncbi:pyridoxal-dependent decarboxylase [Phascolomyces articulosus]|uniref:Pyridoxal-dependent decarboxylase n=1 Tax=Phascolomyces articulosus TaxID=60185 RepID=A0AAD5KB20_9FUNG|nr:pyridoxal-dependent decarboxylase [Phascolomyces articulosus]